MNRRELLKFTAAASSLTVFGNIGWANASSVQTNKKFIWVILRGAQDSLSTLIPHNSPLLAQYRPTLWPKLKPDIIPLTNDFSLHPKLGYFKQLFEEKQLIIVPAVSTGYAARSHFEGQDFMECGLAEIDHSTGWVGRLLNQLNQPGIAVSPIRPFCMRGTHLSTNWYPSNLNALMPSQYESLLNIVSSDPTIHRNLEMALKTRGIINKTNVNADMLASPNSKEDTESKSFSKLCKSCATLLKASNGYSVATLELNGWDTHNNQHQRLNKQMHILNTGIKQLKSTLNDTWKNTCVVITTEFGRTAKENGTQGTDHGTASTMFIAGGNINGGKIEGEWPGIEKQQLFEQRDIQPTANTNSWLAYTLKYYFNMSDSTVAKIFPKVSPMEHT